MPLVPIEDTAECAIWSGASEEQRLRGRKRPDRSSARRSSGVQHRPASRRGRGRGARRPERDDADDGRGVGDIDFGLDNDPADASSQLGDQTQAPHDQEFAAEIYGVADDEAMSEAGSDGSGPEGLEGLDE